MVVTRIVVPSAGNQGRLLIKRDHRTLPSFSSSDSASWVWAPPSNMAAVSVAMWNSIFLGPHGCGCSNTSEGCRAGPEQLEEQATTPLLWDQHGGVINGGSEAAGRFPRALGNRVTKHWGVGYL